MPATALSVPADNTTETVDFLRRLSSMMSGGRNAEMLQEAAAAIETLSRRASAAETLLHDLQDEHARIAEQREVAELAADNLLAELNALKAHLAQSQSQAETEIAALQAELADQQQHTEAEIASLREQLVDKDVHTQDTISALQADLKQRDRLAEIDRRVFAEETKRLRALASRSEAEADTAGIDDTVAVVSVQALQLARTQFGYLAKTFETNGDVISLTMCEIGGQALDKALAGAKE
jgi:chromosome segregation ATPase